MAEENRAVTEGDLEQFATKLTAFAEGLDPSEKAILNQLVANAQFGSAEESDVQGFAIANFKVAAMGSLRPLLGGGLNDHTGFWVEWSARQY